MRVRSTAPKREPGNVVIFARSRASYGDRFDEHVMDQYRLFVETEERLVSRRQGENRFFLTVNSVLLAVLGLLIRQDISDAKAGIGIAILGVAGLTLCWAWYAIIESYKTLNTAKFDVLNQFEVQLPARMFAAEWDAATARGYEPFTVIETRVPIVFGALHIAAIVLGALAALNIVSST
jgi:predicted acyltransferase